MEEIIKRVFNEKLNDGTIEKIIGEKIEEMISSILKDQMSWSGGVKKALEERLKPIMLESVANCDLSQTAAIVTDLLNTAVKTSPVHLIKDTYNGVKTLFSANENAKDISFGKTVKLKEIFEVYTKMIEENNYDESDLAKKDIELHDDYDEGGKYAYIEAVMEVETITEKTYFDGYKTKYQVTLSNNYEDKEITFEITDSYDSSLRLNIDTGNMLLAELRHLPPIFLYLIQLKNNWCKIVIDTESEMDEVQIKVDC
jgi:hypothetical protein